MSGRRRWLALFPLLVAAGSARAQTVSVQCIAPGLDTACKATFGAGAAPQKVELRLLVKSGGAVADSTAVVVFRPTGGFVHPDTARPDAEGIVRATWLRAEGKGGVGIAVTAWVGRRQGVGYIAIDPAPVTDTLQLIARDGFRQSWFENSQLPRAVVVQLRGDGMKEPVTKWCPQQRVAFRPYGAPATVSPDTASAYVDRYGVCYAETFWAMKEGIGERRLTATVVPAGTVRGSSSLTAEAWTRALPRVITGFSLAPVLGYDKKGAPVTRVRRIEREEPTGVKVAYDTTDTLARATWTEEARRWTPRVIAGVSVPIPIGKWGRFDDLSISAGVDVQHPADHFVFGVSAFRMLGAWVPVIEAVPMDIAVVVPWERQERGPAAGCTVDCGSKKRWRAQGVGAMLTVDATSLVTDVVKKLTGG